MGPNNISAKPVSMPLADSSAVTQKQTASSAVTEKIKINYGDDAKTKRLSNAIENVKSLQGRAQEHVEAVKSNIIM